MHRILAMILVVAFAMPSLAQTYHGSARVIPPAGDRENEVFLFDSIGSLVGSYDQIAGARTDAWGYRDGASDGSRVFFGWGGGVARHDADGSNGVLMFDGTNAPGGTYRALAYDPTGDSGSGSLWSASFGSDLLEVDMSGNVLTTWANVPSWSLYGLAFDDSDGNLWGHHTDGEVIKIDTSTGLLTGAGWTNGFPSLAAQGGLSGYSELGGNIAAISQGSPDQLGIYDVAAGNGSFIDLFDLEGQTGADHLGIAVVPEPGSMIALCLGAAVLTARRRRK